MRHFLPILFLLIPPSFVGHAEAKARKNGRMGDVGGTSDLERSLNKAGWEMTPENSASYNVGDIYSRSTNSPVAFKSFCFSAEARESAYTSFEVVQAMKAGAKVPLGVARLKTEATAYKQLSYANPFMKEIADMELRLKPDCQSGLSARADIADLFVITAVLSAELTDQLGRSVDGSAGALGGGTGGGFQRERSRTSNGHVVVAYKTKTVTELMSGMYSPSRSVVQAPVRGRTGGSASLNAAWNSSIGSVSREVGLSQRATQGLQDMLDEPGISDTNDHRRSMSEANPLMQIDNQCLRDAIVAQTREVGRSVTDSRLTQWAMSTSNRGRSEYQFWQDLMDTCPSPCGRLMGKLLSCYTDASSRRYKGLFVFDTGVSGYEPITRGGNPYGRRYNNRDTLAQVLNRLRNHRSEHVLLEGRASLVGNDQANWGLSKHRASNITALLVRNGIAEHRIHYRWVGEGEPYIRLPLARKYGIENHYHHLGEQMLNQSVAVFTYSPT